MDRHGVSVALQERLGINGTADLVELFDTARTDWTAEVIALSLERFERRLVQELSPLRVEIAQGQAALREDFAREFGALRKEIADSRFELIKWSFLFWVGQVIALAGVAGGMLTAFLPR